MTPASPLRTAVLGFGTAGRVFHGPLLAALPDFEVTAIATSAPERAAMARAAHPGAELFATPELLLDASERLALDVVVVATPPATHAPLALAAVERGLQVVLDKPMTVTSAEAASVIEAATRRGVLLSVFQNRRWDGDFLTVVEAIAAGTLGEVWQFDSAFEWWKPEVGERWKDTTTPADGGGILLDLGTHLVDQAIRLFGSVSEVHAELDRRRAGAVADDDTFVSLRHENGVRSRLWMSAVAAESRPRFRVVGSAGVLTVWGLDPQERQLAAGLAPDAPGFGVDPGRRATLSTPTGRSELALRPGAYLEFYREFAEAVRGEGPVPVDPRESLTALELLERASSGADDA